MDFSDFTSQTFFSPDLGTLTAKSPSLVTREAPSDTANAPGDHSNFSFAALNVRFWNIVGALGLAVPVASFTESSNHTPMQQPDLLMGLDL